jgi:SPX domain protein involved in polyphosphate accumulation
VESIYFDSPDLDIFRTHFQIFDGRFKLRMRTYGPNGIWDRECVFLEMKRKNREHTEKFRIRLDPSSHIMLFESDEPSLALSRALVKTNPSIEFRELSLRVQMVDQQLRKLKLRPCSRLYYRRKAFEDAELRVTLDENISTELLMDVPPSTRLEIYASPVWPQAQQMLTNCPIAGGMILEIKNEGKSPKWLLEFFQAHGISEARFSKFCYSITSNFNGAIGAPLTRAGILPVLRGISE